MASESTKKKSHRIALIVSEHTVTEYGTFLGHLLIGLADESIPVALVCPECSNLDSIILGAAEIIRYSSLDLPFIAHFNKRLLTDSLMKFKPTILHCLCESMAPLVRQLARRLELPYVLMVNSLQERWDRLVVSVKRCASIVVPARSIAQNITATYPRFGEIVHQINIGTFAAQTCRCFSTSSRIPTIIISHPFDNSEEYEKLFGALRHLRIEGHEFLVVVIGGGRAERQLWKLLAALAMLQIVTIVPRQTPARMVLNAGDIFIRPQPNTRYDIFLLEAMAVGAVVAGCKGGVDDLIIENETALIFDPDDELSIVGTMQRLLGRQELTRKIAKNAQENLRKNCSVSEMISSTVRLYESARK
ncbi:MAG: glycosyltransferase family 4 protein [Sedimentisphaerales bacterium]|nr:glycosyltransferase family 4 protein [Sedimentisphaerales bacterium]